MYRPNGAILGVAGAIDWPRLRDTIGRLFGEWKPRGSPQVQELPAGPRRDHILRETQQIQIAPAYPAATVASPDYYRARAAAAILGGYSSARLFTEIREKRGLCYSVYSTYEGQLDRAAVLCYAGTAADRAQQTLDVMLAEIERLGREGVAPDELEMMRAGLKGALIMAQESSMSRSVCWRPTGISWAGSARSRRSRPSSTPWLPKTSRPTPADWQTPTPRARSSRSGRSCCGFLLDREAGGIGFLMTGLLPRTSRLVDAHAVSSHDAG